MSDETNYIEKYVLRNKEEECPVLRDYEDKYTSRGLRHNEGKIPLELVPASLNFAVGEVFAYGQKKYARRNWEKGMSWEAVMGCLERHYMKFKSPHYSDIDDESQLHHLKHVAANVAMLIEYLETHPELDDRDE